MLERLAVSMKMMMKFRVRVAARLVIINLAAAKAVIIVLKASVKGHEVRDYLKGRVGVVAGPLSKIIITTKESIVINISSRRHSRLKK